MDNPRSQPPIRRRLGGYRPEDVELRLGELYQTIDRLQGEIEGFRARDAEREAELRRLSAEREAAIAAPERLADEVEEEARRRAGDAARGDLEQLEKLRSDLVGRLREAVHDVAAAIERVERGESPIPEPEPAAPETRPDTVAVAVDAGPFGDVLAVARFESALLALPVVADAYIRRVSGDRAMVEVTVPVGASLIDSMREWLSYSFEVESAEFGHVRIVLTSGARAR